MLKLVDLLQHYYEEIEVTEINTKKLLTMQRVFQTKSSTLRVYTKQNEKAED